MVFTQETNWETHVYFEKRAFSLETLKAQSFNRLIIPVTNPSRYLYYGIQRHPSFLCTYLGMYDITLALPVSHAAI